MLVSRLGIAALILIGLYGLLAVRPFGSHDPAQAADEAQPAEETNFISVEELSTGEPAIQLEGPEGSETYVLRRLPNGEMAIIRADRPEEDVTPDDNSPLNDAERSDQRFRLDLENARQAAISARQEIEATKGQVSESDFERARETMAPLNGLETSDTEDDETVAGETASDDAFEDMVRSAIDRSVSPRADRDPPPARNPDLPSVPEPSAIIADAVREEALLTTPMDPAAVAAAIETRYEGKVLMGEDFSGQNLAGVSFKRSVLTGADFTGANLTGANFAGAKLQGAYFNKANLIDADLRSISAQAAKFQKADLRRANLENANLTGADLTGADLRGSQTIKLVLNGVTAEGARFDPVPLTGKRRTTPLLTQ